MLDISILSELTADTCAAVTDRRDAAVLLRTIDEAHLFLVALDDERASFRYHHLVRQMLRTELRTRDRTREQTLQLRAGEWFETAGDTRRAVRHFLAANQADRALALLRHDRVVADYMHNPELPPALDLSLIDAEVLTDTPDRLLGLASDLLVTGDVAHGGQYLELLERVQSSIAPESRLAAQVAVVRSFHAMLVGQAQAAVREGLAAWAIRGETQLADDTVSSLQATLVRAYTWLEDFAAVDRVVAIAAATPSQLPESFELVLAAGAQALAWFESGHLAKAADAAMAADTAARRPGFGRHFFAVDHLRTLAGLALERRDLDTAEQLTEQVLSISEHRRPSSEFLALLQRARIWAARGQTREALTTVEAARPVLAGTRSELLARADELEALLRLQLGDRHAPAELAMRLPAARQALLLARAALATGDPQAAQEQLQAPSLAGELTPRRALVRQILLAAAAIERGDPTAAAIVASAVEVARQEGFCHTVVTTAPQVTSYLIEQAGPDPFVQRLIEAALNVRAVQQHSPQAHSGIIEPLTTAELRVLKLLPTSSYQHIAATYFISHHTVKAHLRSIYRKLGVTSRSEAIGRAVDLQLL